MPPPEPRADFALLPLEQQMAALDRALATAPVPNRDGVEHADLLADVARLRDHAPIAYLLRKLADRGWLSLEAHRTHLARAFATWPDTAVDRVCRELLSPPVPSRSWEPIGQALVAALAAMPVERLSALCLVDRTLKRHFPDRRNAWLARVRADCEKALTAGRVADIALGTLALVKAAAFPSLREIAASAGVLAEFDALRQTFAAKAIAVLADAPKAVSQANAEELLSRRVYTDPAHFLVELLQNAEDAGATTWKVTFDARRIVVWHDGAPFDARDVGRSAVARSPRRPT